MNFFGHVVVACRVSDHQAFLLGAMAPDLLSLCGAVPGEETSAEVAVGQAHHRAVDAAFHGSPAFTALTAWASGALAAAGLPRGGARGAAHVGIELLLDGELAAESAARDAYARSLADADGARAPFVWRDRASGQRWGRLMARLRTGAVPEAYRDLDFVAARALGALRHRPRLAIPPAQAPALRAFLPELAARVRADAGALVGAGLRCLGRPTCLPAGVANGGHPV